MVFLKTLTVRMIQIIFTLYERIGCNVPTHDRLMSLQVCKDSTVTKSNVVFLRMGMIIVWWKGIFLSVTGS